MTPIRSKVARAAHGEDQQTGECATSAACKGGSAKTVCGPFVERCLAAYRNGVGKHAV